MGLLRRWRWAKAGVLSSWLPLHTWPAAPREHLLSASMEPGARLCSCQALCHTDDVRWQALSCLSARASGTRLHVRSRPGIAGTASKLPNDVSLLCQAAQARAGGRSPASVVPAGVAPQELFRRPGHFHSRLQNIEYECWVHPRALPPAERLQVRIVLD